MISEEKFFPGMAVESALGCFRHCVNRPETIFSTDHWLEPRLSKFRPLLTDPITSEQALALEDVLLGRHFMKDLIQWLQAPAMSWADFVPYREQQISDALWKSWKQEHRTTPIRRGRSAEKIEHCPKCGSLSVVGIVYGLLSEETMEAKRRGAIDFVQGGCCIPLKSGPSRYCRQCKHRWPNGEVDEES